MNVNKNGTYVLLSAFSRPALHRRRNLRVESRERTSYVPLSSEYYNTTKFIVTSRYDMTTSFQPSTPTKPVQFSDWVSGISPPDPATINKHVHDMVDVSVHADVITT